MGLIICAVSLALSLLVIEPIFRDSGGITDIISGKARLEQGWEGRFRPFLEKNSDLAIAQSFTRIAKERAASEGGEKMAGENGAQPEQVAISSVSFGVLLSSFVITELREAFQLGVLLLLPFLIIDLLVATALASLSIAQLSVAIVSLPLKLLLFVSLDGWKLLSERLFLSYVVQ